jgi:predicted nucleic acid-binding protein
VVIYVDSSVLLAWVFGEPRQPRPDFWQERLVASRLLAYESWTRVNAYLFGQPVRDGLQTALSCVTLVDMRADILGPPEETWPLPVRTLDRLHLATARYLRIQAPDLHLATFDKRMAECALALRIPLYDLPR